MARSPLGTVLQHIRKLAGPIPADDGDGRLLAHFLLRRDETAFAALVERHGPMVLGVCRRVLRQEQDAEDAFQATFLVLAHKAAALDGGGSLAGWLHTVAHRLALRLRAQSVRRQLCEQHVAVMRPAEAHDEPGAGKLLALIEEELHALPDKYRAPLVLCHLEGKTHEQAARELGWPAGSLWKRLERGRELLRARLLRRGVAPAVGLLAAAWCESASAALPAGLLDGTTRVAGLVAAGTAPAAVPAHILTLAQGTLRAMALARGRLLFTALLLVTLLGGGTAALMHRAFAEAPPPDEPAEPLLAFAPVPADPEPKEAPALAEWPMFRGDAGRSARGKGAVTALRLLWSVKTTEEKQTTTWVEEALADREKAGAGVVPAFFPITASGKVIFRTHRGVSAVPAETGEMYWENASSSGLDRLLRDATTSTEIAAWVAVHRTLGRGGIVLENSTLGQVSTDGKLVYSVEDLAVLPPALGPAAQRTARVLRREGSQLLATSLRTGKLMWELGDPLGPKEQQDGHFHGPPLPLGERLYVLYQKAGEFRLLCIDPAVERGKFPLPEWGVKLAAAPDAIPVVSPRRIQAAPIAAADDVLICPTNAGQVIAFDLKKRKVAWTHEYKQPKLGDALDAGWKATGPIIHDRTVIVTAPDCEDVVCLWLRDGKVRWRAKREGDVYVAGVFGNDVLLVGDKSCRALSVADGTVRWRIDTGRPTGIGVAGDGVYYLPLANFGKSAEPEVCVIDLHKRAVKAHLRTGKKVPFGNLLLYEGRLLSQTATSLSAFAEKETKP
jgi:RNA polymerase sigma factor (sigma-70 family)